MEKRKQNDSHASAATVMQPDPATLPTRRMTLLVSVLLAAATLIVFWRVTRCDFVDFDDPLDITTNLRVKAGLAWSSVQWAFNPVGSDYWRPMTWLSHMVDVEFYGMNPHGHHFTNLLLHTANVLLLFALLRLTTKAFWRSAIVAALFAWHPLQVESVAWVTERKDVLSTFFGFLSLLFYTRYAQLKIANRKSQIANYPLALFFFALGLMSKPMLVTWPFVMLLLDWWPLRRISDLKSFVTRHSSLLVEKIPFFALSAVFSLITVLLQKKAGQVVALAESSLTLRFETVLAVYARYLGKVLWPFNLSIFYPMPDRWPLPEVIFAMVVVTVLCGVAVWKVRDWPYVFAGWFWFFGTLVPVIGLLRVGTQFMADRFTYVPIVGLFIALVWAAGERCARWKGKIWCTVATTLVLVGCVLRAHDQLGHWKNTETLFRHAIAVTGGSGTAFNNLGIALAKIGRLDEAIVHFREALRRAPDQADTHFNLGNALVLQRRLDEAMHEYSLAVRLRPNFWLAHYNLGVVYEKQGRVAEAMEQYAAALRLNRDHVEAHNCLGYLLLTKGLADEATAHYQQSLRLDPRQFKAHFNLGNAYALKQQYEAAVEQFTEALRLSPNSVPVRINLGRALDRLGRRTEAIVHLQEALRLETGNEVARQLLRELGAPMPQ